MLEIWQANAHGRLNHPEDTRNLPVEPAVEPVFRGFGRIFTDSQGGFDFTTIKPGRVTGPGNTLQAPHIVVFVFARGLLKPLLTRIYFPPGEDPGEDNAAANTADAVLNLAPAERRSTMIASPATEGANVLHWDVVLQGERETVFFDW